MQPTSIATTILVAAVAFGATLAPVGSVETTVVPEPLPQIQIPLYDRVFDSLWSIPVLYDNPDNPYIQRVAIIGRYQGQLWGLNSDFGSAGGWQNRRVRIGGRMHFLHTFDAWINFNLNFDGADTGRFVRDIDEFVLRWRPCDVFNLEGGLFKVPITNEWRASSNLILTVERSLFVNQAVPERIGGFLVGGNVSGFLYGLGVYSGSRNDDWRYPTLDGGAVIYSGIGWQFNGDHVLRFDNGALTDSPGNNATRPYSWTASLSYSGKFLDRRLWLQTDLVTAIGEPGIGDLYGFIILPSFDITDRIQLVLRYQFLTSNQSDGIRLQGRYERFAPDLPTTYGNNYQAVYGGINFYIYKDRMKIMSGMEYAHLELTRGGGYNSLTLFAAFRMWF